MTPPEITLRYKPVGSDGVVVLTASADGRKIHAAEIAIDDADARERFATELSQLCAAVDERDVAAEGNQPRP